MMVYRWSESMSMANEATDYRIVGCVYTAGTLYENLGALHYMRPW